MGIDIGVANRNIQKLHSLTDQHSDQLLRFCHVRLSPLAFCDSEPKGIGKAVINIHPAGHNESGLCRALGACIGISEKPGTVFKGASVPAGARIRRQQFIIQIPVAALDINSIKSGLLSQQSCLPIDLLQLLQAVISNDPFRRNWRVFFK